MKKQIWKNVMLFIVLLCAVGALENKPSLVHGATSSNQVTAQTKEAKRNGWYTTKSGYRYYYKSGKKVTGIQKIGNYRYYFTAKGRLYKGKGAQWITVKGKKYYLLNSGILKVGWQKVGNNTYYLKRSNAQRATGWTNIAGKRYYFDSKGRMVANKNLKLGNQRYLLSANGSLATTGFHTRGKYTYYVLKNGIIKTNGWQKVQNKWYYFHQNGTMARGWQNIGKYRYYMDSNGVRQTGLIKIGNYYYNFTPNKGIMTTGWRTVNGQRYYFSPKKQKNWPKGAMVHSSWLRSGNHYYYLKNTGVMATQWYQVKTKWYYFRVKTQAKGPVGSRATGWLTSLGNKYYLNKNGVRQTGWQTINGNRYYFNGNGIMYKNSWATVAGKQYYFNSVGILQVSKWIDSEHYVGSDGAWIEGYGQTENNTTGWRWPLSSSYRSISSYFGGRESPGGIGSTNHQGIDIPAPNGTPIYAVANGTIVVRQGTSSSGGFGNWIQINHGGGLITEYAHMSKFASGIAVGTKVTKGKLIGYVGSTGNSTGNHLHFGVVKNGTRVNPLNYVSVP